MKDYFPAKLAHGNRFCNRVKEQAILRRNIEMGRHTVEVGPRRYGKSSLAHKVIEDLGLPAAYIDLFLASDDKTVAMRILAGINDLIAQIMPVSQKAKEAIQEYFTKFNISFSINGVSLGLSYKAPEDDFDAALQVHEALKSLSKLANQENKKVIIFIDEFQDIVNAVSSKTIEGAIRNIAQSINNIVFIFSGSSRHLLLNLFDDKNKPLYMLCDKIILERMSSDDYRGYVQTAAKEKWRAEIDESLFHKMMILTELHPFYVNMLGTALWQSEHLPTKEEEVSAAWEKCFDQEKRRLMAELEALSLNQQRVIKYLAKNPAIEPYSKTVLNDVNLSISSMRQCIKVLLEKDMVYRITIEDALVGTLKKNQYRVLDPLLSYALRRHF